MKRKQASNFGIGGVFACRSCKRKTRSTGRGDNENVDLCVECYELAGIENAFLDGDGSPAYLQEAKALLADCIAKGGKTSAKEWNIPGLGE